MASISSPSLLPVKQALFPLVGIRPSTIVLEFLGEKAERTLHSARRLLQTLINVNITCEEPIHLVKRLPCFKNLYKPSDFPIRLNGYKIQKVDSHKVSDVQTDAKIAVFKANAVFSFSYFKNTQTCLINSRFRAKLPVWMKWGNPECWVSRDEGIPTAKVMSKLILDKLGLTKDNVQTILSHSMNPQTIVDVAHALLVQGKTMEQAFALAHTSHLNAEIAQMLGAHGVRLVSVKRDHRVSFSKLEYLLDTSDLTKKQKIAFKNQPKLREIEEFTGIKFFDDNPHSESRQHVCVPDMITLAYRVTAYPPRRVRAPVPASFSSAL